MNLTYTIIFTFVILFCNGRLFMLYYFNISKKELEPMLITTLFLISTFIALVSTWKYYNYTVSNRIIEKGDIIWTLL